MDLIWPAVRNTLGHLWDWHYCCSFETHVGVNILELLCKIHQSTNRHVVRSGCLAWVNSGEGPLHTGWHQTHSSCVCASVLFRISKRLKSTEHVEQPDVTLTGLWWGWCLCSSSIVEVFGYFPAVLAFLFF